MPDFDASFKFVTRVSGREVAQLGGIVSRVWQPLGGEVQATERLADRAFRAREGRERFVVYMEAYTRWDASVPWSVLAKAGLLSERERLPTRCLVYVLLPRGYQEQGGTFRLEVAGTPTQQVWFREVCLWKQRPAPWWEAAPGLMALYPLCRHELPPEQAVAHAAEAISRQVTENVTRATLLTTLAIFGRMTLPQPVVLDLIGRKQMIESPMYDEIMEEGRIETQRENIKKVLANRFGPEAIGEFAETLERIPKLKQLSKLFDALLSARDLAAFRKVAVKTASK